jgi:diguanylate cyclase (GGDEF)-like protein
MQQKVSEILAESRQDENILVDKVNWLAKAEGEQVYSEVLQQLVGKKFPQAQASHYWQQAIGQFSTDCNPDCSLRGVRSSLLSYLFRVAGEMRDPRIVEADELAEYQRASVTDGLTGLYHQTYFKAHLEQLVERVKRDSGQGFAVVMLDLDHFKQYNDRCGHLAGDQALRQVSAILQQCIRQADLASRYGGEEFALILHRLNQPQAAMVAERIRQAIDSFDFDGQDQLDRGNLSISGGVAFFGEDGESALSLLQSADERLYRAKQRRNTIYPLNQDQRQAPRRPIHSLVEYIADQWEEPCQALSHDLSDGGIALACETGLQPGSSVEIRFRQPFWPVDCSARGIVRNTSNSQDNRLVRVGLQFEQEEAYLNHLLPAAQAG